MRADVADVGGKPGQSLGMEFVFLPAYRSEIATVWSQGVRWCNDEERRRREARGHVDCDFPAQHPFTYETEIIQWLHPLTNAW
jgi:hypothetical protein